LATRIHAKLPAHVELDDLIAYGQVGLAEAARDFDPSRGSRFSTYAYYRIRGAIYDGLAKMSWLGRGHYQHVRYEQLAGEALHAASETADASPPSLETDARWFRDISRALAVVYLTTPLKCRETGQELTLADSARFGPPELAMSRELRQKLEDLINALPHAEGVLVRAAHFEGVTLQEAGQRLGISKSWATRLHARALQRLSRGLRLVGVAS
jgi:RNA polymerase sigma factor for flagellar operon FliA